MILTIDSILYLLMVSVLWGVTNPLIKKGAEGLQNVKASSPLAQFVKDVCFLFTNPKYMMPFLVNQCGSVLYFFTLQSTDLSLAVPVTNSLTFVFTGVTGWILGEDKVRANTYAGMMLILAGTTLCCLDKLNGVE